MRVLTAVLIVLIVLIVMAVYCTYRLWRTRRLGPPADCSDYPNGPLTFMCKTGVGACGKLDGRDADACRAAVGSCMPVARAAYDHYFKLASRPSNRGGLNGGEDVASFFNRVAPLVPDCAAATYQISPAGAAKAFDSLGITNSIPPELAPLYKDAEARQNIQTLAGLVPDAVKWSLAFGQNLPVKGSFTPSPSHRCDPLYPRPECYDDMGCRAGG